MKAPLLALPAALAVLLPAVPAHAAHGAPDPNWGGSGFVTTDFPSTFGPSDGMAATGLVVQRPILTQPSIFRLVAAGWARHAGRTRWAIARYLPADGSLDSGFATGGRNFIDFANSTEERANALVTTAGGMFAAGFATPGGSRRFALAGIRGDGSVASTTTLGPFRTSSGTSSTADEAYGLARLSDGGVVAAGYASFNGAERFALTRVAPDGSVVSSFGGGDGRVVTSFAGGDDVAYGVAVQPDGKLVAVGSARLGTSSFDPFSWAIARYLPDGQRDTSFGGGDGELLTDFGAGLEAARAVALQPDGKIVAAGFAGAQKAVARYLPDGRLDSSFGSGGKVIGRDLGEHDATSIVLQPDGKIALAGEVRNVSSSGTTSFFELTRYESSGSLDRTFGASAPGATDGDGTVTHRFFLPTQRARAFAYARQPDGFLVAAGDACCQSGYFTPLFALGRYHGLPGADPLKVNLALRASRLARVLRRRKLPVEVAAHDLSVRVRVAVRLVGPGRKRLLIARGKLSVPAFGRRTRSSRVRRAGRQALTQRRQAGKPGALLITAAGRDALGGRGKVTIRARLG